MPEAKERFDYHLKDWWPEIRWYDWVPIVGFALAFERMSRQRGKSLAEALLPWKSPLFRREPKEVIRTIVFVGTENWPEASSGTAAVRSCLMAARNGLFPAYHFVAFAYPLLRAIDMIQ